ncbi:unnamed protein product [Orchesella dallaii]|uniref:Uncharacterized protein n=1 Tax=Orchesella dallaii TaxID=48710 RepID=A0ABP1QY30_9HEXA
MDAVGCGIFLWQSEIDKYICRNGCDESTCLAKIVNLRFPETQAKCHFNNSDIHDIIESKLKIVDSGSLRGPAVVTTKPVRKGAIVAEYCGIYREPCKCNSCVVEKFTVSKCACFYGNTPCSELHMYANNKQAKKPMQSSSKANLKTRKKYAGFRDSEKNFALSKKRGRGRPRKASENHSNSIRKKKSRVNKAQVAAAIRNVIGLPRTVNSTATELNKIIDEVSKLPEEDPDIEVISCINGQLDDNIEIKIIPMTRASENLICCICEKYSPCTDCEIEILPDAISTNIEDGSDVATNDCAKGEFSCETCVENRKCIYGLLKYENTGICSSRQNIDSVEGLMMKAASKLQCGYAEKILLLRKEKDKEIQEQAHKPDFFEGTHEVNVINRPITLPQPTGRRLSHSVQNGFRGLATLEKESRPIPHTYNKFAAVIPPSSSPVKINEQDAYTLLQLKLQNTSDAIKTLNQTSIFRSGATHEKESIPTPATLAAVIIPYFTPQKFKEQNASAIFKGKNTSAAIEKQNQTNLFRSNATQVNRSLYTPDNRKFTAVILPSSSSNKISEQNVLALSQLKGQNTSDGIKEINKTSKPTHQEGWSLGDRDGGRLRSFATR